MKTVRILNWIFLGASIFLLLAIPVMGIGSAAANWQGMCYGFTDSQAPCSWWEFAKNEMFWSSFMFVPLLALMLGVWLVVNIIQWVVISNRKKSLKIFMSSVIYLRADYVI
jgi:hypothetical protein